MPMTIIAHRCGPDIYPEQTIISARHALSLGADIVEMDVQYTLDGVPVICHDLDARRTFGVDRLIAEMDVETFLTLRHLEDRTYASHTLDDVLSTGIAPILLHCKLSGERIADIVAHLKAFDYGEEGIVGVLEPEDVRIVKAVNPAVQTLAFMKHPDRMDDFISAGADIIRLWEPWVTQERIDHVHASGRALWVMAGDARPDSVGYTSVENIRAWEAMGIEGVLVNDIAWARRALGYGSPS